MARPYEHLTVEQLEAEIAEYTAAIKAATLGGEVGVVAGEGRRMEVTPVNANAARLELRELRAELARRDGQPFRGRAIRVEIG